MIKLTDDSPMPFGKFKGKRMEEVPASYLHWLWTQESSKETSVMLYIKDNMGSLKQEHPDGIWD